MSSHCKILKNTATPRQKLYPAQTRHQSVHLRLLLSEAATTTQALPVYVYAYVYMYMYVYIYICKYNHINIYIWREREIEDETKSEGKCIFAEMDDVWKTYRNICM